MSVSKLRALWRDTDGNTLVGFALLSPVLLSLTLGIVEFSLLAFDFHRANEATRRIARAAAMTAPLVSETTLTSNGTAQCSGAGCAGLDALTDGADDIFPDITVSNVQVTYSLTGIGDLATPGGVKPLITVTLTGLTHDLVMLGAFPGLPTSITFPSFSTSILGTWYPPA
jgi:Flp pilus assembly protein TadG